MEHPEQGSGFPNVVELSGLNALPLHGKVLAKIIKKAHRVKATKRDGSEYEQVTAKLSVRMGDIVYEFENTAWSFPAQDEVLEAEVGEDVILAVGIQPCATCRRPNDYRQVQSVVRKSEFDRAFS